MLHKFNKSKNKETEGAQNLYNEYKRLQNILTSKKREFKKDYYTSHFDQYKNKVSVIWKGIKSLVNITTSSKKDINIINNQGRKITEIADQFNNHYVNVVLQSHVRTFMIF